jgi:pyrimidine operon attenuation protein/uracil phosphoribosyltransferase
METVQKNCVMDKESIQRKMRRMALEIAEDNIEEKDLIIAGIEGNGEVVADNIIRELKNIAPFNTTRIVIHLNKKNPVEIRLSEEISFDNKVVILADDVANTGKTMMFALKPFLSAHAKKIQTLVLVERSHKLFPVQTDYAGLSISTTLLEHIAVETEKGVISGAWLY